MNTRGARTGPEQAVDLDLFAGAGGLAVGLKQAGFSPAHFYECDRHCCETLRRNTASDVATLRGPVCEEDIEKLDWSHIDTPVRLLAAGAPCQPFSLGGKHRAEHDGRNLFPEVIRAIRGLRPAVVMLENVRGLVRESFQPYFQYVIQQLEFPFIKPQPKELWHNHAARIRRHRSSTMYEPAYRVTWRVFDAADFGVPQNRQRVFIVATRADLPAYDFPSPTHSRSALLRSQISGEYWQRHSLKKPRVMPGNGAKPDPDDNMPAWITVRDALRDAPEPAPNEKTADMNHWSIPGARAYAGHVGSHPDWPSKTIKAGVHGVPGGENALALKNGCVRYYTLRETARIQTFPDSHYFVGARLHVTRQIGNAIPCALAAAIATPLFELVKNRTTQSEGGSCRA